MTVLHLVTRSAVLEACLNRLGKGDALLLLADGVYAVAPAGGVQQLNAVQARGGRCHVLQADLDARGLGDVDLPPDILPVDYPGFVALSAEHRHSQTWC